MKNNKKLCSKCKVEEVVNTGYCSACKSEYDNARKSMYLYLIEVNGVIEYVGQTDLIQRRMSYHINGHCESTRHLFRDGIKPQIKFLDVSHIVNDRMELNVLENELMWLYEPRCNEVKNIIRGIDKLRIFSLQSGLHSLNNQWSVYEHCKKS